jgi:hypothetical protein
MEDYVKQNPDAAAIRNCQTEKFASAYFDWWKGKHSAMVAALASAANQQIVP